MLNIFTPKQVVQRVLTRLELAWNYECNTHSVSIALRTTSNACGRSEMDWLNDPLFQKNLLNVGNAKSLMPIIHIPRIFKSSPTTDHGTDDGLPRHDIFPYRRVDMYDHKTNDVPHEQMVPGVHILAFAK